MLLCDYMNKVAKLFGSPQRTRILVAVALLDQTYPRELARVLDLPLLTVQRVLADYESEGFLASRMVGHNRIYSLNPRTYGTADLKALLEKYAARTDVPERLETLRRRPRRPGKAI